MNEKSLISIIVLNYNAGELLLNCIDSLKKSTYQNIEIIAVDDGSEDSSLNILKKYSDKIHIFSQKNQQQKIEFWPQQYRFNFNILFSLPDKNKHFYIQLNIHISWEIVAANRTSP